MTRLHVITLVLLAALTVALPAVGAGNGSGYSINWQVQSAGGAPSSVGGLSLNATVGQLAVGPSSVGTARLGGGFWSELYLRFLTHLPDVTKNVWVQSQ